ncbi:response regulator [Paenibacillus sp. TH7-28]
MIRNLYSSLASDGADKRIRMLIVDDESVICQGLHYTIDWEELGVEVVGEAYDGQEALRLVAEQNVDLLLTDIRMDGMDGLELAARLRQDHPEVQVVMISGYEDFGYARQAIRLGVNDYLLKPVDIEELTEVVKKIVQDIRVRQSESSDQEIKLWLLGMARHGTAYGKEAPASLQGVQFRILATQLAEFHERFANMEQEHYETVQDSWLRGLHGHLECASFRTVSVFDHDNLLITLLLSETWVKPKIWDDLLASAIPPLAPFEGGRIYCGASRIYENLADTADRCAEAARLLAYHALEGRRVLLAGDDEELLAGRKKADFDIAGTVQRLVSALFKQDQKEVKTLVEEMFGLFRESRFLLAEIVKTYEELLALLRQRLRKSGMTGLDFGHQGQLDLNIYNSYAGLETLVLEDMEELQRLIDKNGIDKSYWIIEKAKKFIIEQHRTDLKASEVASWLKITPSYFSYIFKQSTGKGFTEYMNEMRIEHAKALLATTHDKVFEIADKVGYKEYKYFVSVFKSYTGMTPKEYRGLMVSMDAAADPNE